MIVGEGIKVAYAGELHLSMRGLRQLKSTLEIILWRRLQTEIG